MAELILASASPRRRLLLAMLGVEVDVVPAELDEIAIAANLAPIEAVVALAGAKVSAVPGDRRVTLAADTEVVHEDTVLGKPTDRDHAREMLRRVSGHSVEVLTGVAVRDRAGIVTTATATSILVIDELDDEMIDAYLDTGQADDKAGALAVQGAAGAFVTVSEGTRSNVYGLPLAETAALLRAAGIGVRQPGTGGL